MSVGLPDAPEALPTRAELQARLDDITSDEQTLKGPLTVESALQLINDTNRKSPETVVRVIDAIGLTREGLQRIFQLEDVLRSLNGESDTEVEKEASQPVKKKSKKGTRKRPQKQAKQEPAAITDPHETDGERRLRLMRERHNSMGISHLGLQITDIDIDSLPPHMRPGAAKRPPNGSPNGHSTPPATNGTNGAQKNGSSQIAQAKPAPASRPSSSRSTAKKSGRAAEKLADVRLEQSRRALDAKKADLDRRESELDRRFSVLADRENAAAAIHTQQNERQQELDLESERLTVQAEENAQEAARLEKLQADIKALLTERVSQTAAELRVLQGLEQQLNPTTDLNAENPALASAEPDEDATTLENDEPTIPDPAIDTAAIEEVEEEVEAEVEGEVEGEAEAEVEAEVEEVPPIITRPRSPETIIRRKRPVYVPADVPAELADHLSTPHEDVRLQDLPKVSLDVLTALTATQLLHLLADIGEVEHSNLASDKKIAEQTGIPLWLLRDMQANADNIEYAAQNDIPIWRPGELKFTTMLLNRGSKPSRNVAEPTVVPKPKKKRKKRKKEKDSSKKTNKPADHVADFQQLVPEWEQQRGSLAELSAEKRRQEKEAALTAACNNGLTLSQNRYGWRTVQPHLDNSDALAAVLEENGWTNDDVAIWQAIFPRETETEAVDIPAYTNSSATREAAWQRYEDFNARYQVGDITTTDEDDTDRRLNELEAAADHDVAAVLRTAVEHNGKAVQHLLAEHEYEKARKRKGKGPATVFEAIQRFGHDEDYKPRITDEADFTPTTSAPGSEQKLAELVQRVQAGQPLWHPGDRFDFSGATDVRPRYD